MQLILINFYKIICEIFFKSINNFYYLMIINNMLFNVKFNFNGNKSINKHKYSSYF